MKTYVITTGVIFGLLTLAHLWRILDEPHQAANPWYVLTTLAAGVFSFWAWRLVRLTTRS